MKALACSLVLALTPLVVAQSVQSAGAQIVEFSSGNLHLKGYLWKPPGRGPFPAVLFNHGSGGNDSMQTSGMPISQAAGVLAPIFLKHGYAFFYPCRRGHGLSADRGEFIQDVLKRQEAAGIEARQKLQFELMTGPHLDDTLAAFSFLKTVPEIDTHRIAIVGHSFGGQLALLDAERERNLSAVVTFGAAANSWDKSPELRERLLAAVTKARSPIMLIPAANDYSTTPGRKLAAELERIQKPHILKIYPAVGRTSDEGHNAVYTASGIWEADVFAFLDQNVGH